MLAALSQPGAHRPLTCLAVAHSLATFGLAYTAASQSRLRQAVSLGVGLSVLAVDRTLLELSNNASLRCLVTTFAWAQLVNTHDLLCLTKMDYRTAALPASSSRLRWALGTQWNLRRMGTPHQAKNTPPICNWGRDPTYIPSRARFALDQLCTIAASVAYMLFVGLHSSKDGRYHSGDREALLRRLPDVTWDEAIYRAKATIAFLTGIGAISQICYCVLGLVFVLSGLSEPRMWPGWFGAFAEAYSIRNWWGRFWHQTWRGMLTQNANWISRDVLDMPSTGIATRYTKIFIVFLISGLIHLAPDLTIGIPLNETNAVSFFTMQAMGIMVEDFVQYVNRRLGLVKSPLLQRLVGYAWVGVWFFWQVPKWPYPTARYMDTDKDYILTYSMQNATAPL